MSEKVKIPEEMDFSCNHAEAWKLFLQKFQIYLKASKNEKETEEYKGALLLNTIGDKALKIYNNFKWNLEEEKEKYSKIKQKFSDYFAPTSNETYERHIFLTRDKKPNETVDEYVIELRHLSSTCGYGELTDSLIRDKLLHGMKDKSIKSKLLRTKDLDLQKAIEICKVAEVTKNQLDIICKETPVQDEEDVMVVQKQEKDRRYADRNSHRKFKRTDQPMASSSRAQVQRKISKKYVAGHSRIDNNNRQSMETCQKCGFKHARNNCKAYGKRCGICGMFNHFARMCRNNGKMVCNLEAEEDVEDLFIGTLSVMLLVADGQLILM